MRTRRGLLFWGLLLIPLGGVPLLVRAGIIDSAPFAEAWRLWPLILVGVGLAVLVGRTRAAVIGTAVLALTIGGIGGAALARPQDWSGVVTDCGPGGQVERLERSGTLDGRASIRLDLRCGSIELAPTSSSEWTFAAEYRDSAPRIEVQGDYISVRTAPGAGRRHENWTVGVPAGRVGDIDLTANAASATFDLDAGTLTRFAANVNAGDLRVDAEDASIDRLDVTLNAGRFRLSAGGKMSGRVSVNAGAIDLCVPGDAGLRLTVAEQLTFVTNLNLRGLSRSGSVWTRAPSGDASTIALDISGNAAGLTLDPEGGCR